MGALILGEDSRRDGVRRTCTAGGDVGTVTTCTAMQALVRDRGSVRVNKGIRS